MEKLIFLFSVFASLILMQFAYAQQQVVPAAIQPSISWTSKTPAEVITVNNGSGNKLTIMINVDKSPVTTDNKPTNIPQLAGVTVSNCGDTRHIDAGSSAVCTTSDPANPVSFSTESPINPATGSYMIKQEPR